MSTDADFELCLIKFKCENCISLRSFLLFCESENSHQVAAPSEERIRIIKQNVEEIFPFDDHFPHFMVIL